MQQIAGNRRPSCASRLFIPGDKSERRGGLMNELKIRRIGKSLCRKDLSLGEHGGKPADEDLLHIKALMREGHQKSNFFRPLCRDTYAEERID